MYSSNTTTQFRKCNNKRLTQDQAQLLEISFNFDPKLGPDRKFHLAQQLGLPARQVAIWYQNKRARSKTQSLEMDYNALQLRLESALAENKTLEKEVQKVSQELESAHEMLRRAFSSNSYSDACKCNSSCDEARSSTLLMGESYGRLESELYACLIGNIEGKL